MYSFYEYLAFFVIYAFLGWCAEVIFNAVNTGHFVNRGFLNGPVCPIYGFGMVIVVLCLTPLQKNWLLLFLGSMVLTSALEWLTGYVLKKVFHTSWWDYSDQPFNIGGYICLRFSILWGLGCVMVMYLVHPMITRFVRWVPALAGQVIIAICLFCFACDFYVTVAGILKFNRRLKRLEEVRGLMHDLSEDIGSGLAEGALKLAGTGEKLKESSAQWREEAEQKRTAFRGTIEARQEQFRLTAEQKKQALLGSIEEKKARLAQLSQEYERIMQEKMSVRLLKAFPNARSERYNEALEKSVRKSAPNEKGRLEISKERNPAQKAGNPPAGIKWPQPLRKPGGKGGAYAVLFLFTRLRQNRRFLTRAQPKNFSENKKPWHLPWLF